MSIKNLLYIMSLMANVTADLPPEPAPPDLQPESRHSTASRNTIIGRNVSPDSRSRSVLSDSGKATTLPEETKRERATRLQRDKRRRASLDKRAEQLRTELQSDQPSTSQTMLQPKLPVETARTQNVTGLETTNNERNINIGRNVSPKSRSRSIISDCEKETNKPEETKRERANRLQRDRRRRASLDKRAEQLRTELQSDQPSTSQTMLQPKLPVETVRTQNVTGLETTNNESITRDNPAQLCLSSNGLNHGEVDINCVETERERQNRLRRERRSRETEEQRERRLATDAQKTAETREIETEEQRTQRLATEARRSASNRRNQPVAAVEARRVQERERHRARNNVPDEPIGFSSNVVPQHYLGPMSVICTACGAKYFQGESNQQNGTSNICCNFGNIHIDHFSDFPDGLKNLFIGSTPSSTNFRNNARSFNSSLAMASMGAQLSVPSGPGPFCFKVHGQVYHHVGPLEPLAGSSPQFGQLYILDTNQAAIERMGKSMNMNCDPAIMKYLSELIVNINPYAQSFKMMNRVALEEEQRAAALHLPRPNVRMMFHVDNSMDLRRYNVPESNETAVSDIPIQVAAVFVGEDNDVPPTRSIAVHLAGGGLQRIRDVDKLCDPLTYPLFFPKGNFGWHPEMSRTVQNPDRRRTRVTQREYYSFLLSIRQSFNPLLLGCKLLQQFVVDSWVKIEQNRLNYARTHQEELRSDAYQLLLDHVNTGMDNTVPGARIILPSSFSGTPRNMQQGYQDAMSIVTKYGKPTYFLTVTCSPKWREIVENLLPHQTASDRPDLVTRVFNMKLKALLDDLLKNHVLGEVQAYILVIEWQKRGLPHCHMLLTMKPNFKPHTPEQVDKVIRAFLPDKETEPELFEIVSSAMMHKNCGVNNPTAPCMKDGICSKQFPKQHQEQTQIEDDSFPLYRRPDDGRTVTIGNTVYDNRWVVPHNAYLCLRYNAHINLEICSMLHAVKYLFKYVYKGIDRATLRLKQVEQTANGQPIDEIKAHLDTRYICAPEAMHRIFEFDVQRKSDVVYRLQVHLPEQQTVVFQNGKLDAALQRAGSKLTTLTAWFKMNREYDPTAANVSSVNPREILYINFPEHFTFVKTSGLWKIRQRGIRQIGRMYMCSPRDRERYCLRLLLLTRKGLTSFEDARTVNARIFPSFSAAATELGLLRDENNFDRTMTEAVGFGMPSQLRSLFGALLAFSDVGDPPALWEKYRDDLSEDYFHQGHCKDDSYAHAYYDILESASCMGIDLNKYITAPTQHRPSNTQQQLSPTDHANIGADMYANLTTSQKSAADGIFHPSARRNSLPSCYFVDGPGGSGKTYLYNCLYHLFLGEGKRVACVAWTGIAANLLPEGRTLHSLFKLSIPQSNRISTIKNQSKEARLLREIDVFVVDECSMIPRVSLDAIDQLLRDTMANDIPFGGKIMILGGDFRQVLPVVERGRGCDAVGACLKQSPLFTSFQKFTLTQNMRSLPGSHDWSEFLLSIGNGTLEEDENGCVQIPDSMVSEGNLLSEIFEDQFDDPSIFSERAILAPKNVDVNDMNDSVLQRLRGQERVFRSIDEVDSEDADDVINFPMEFLNKQNPAGSPPHLLRLKVGCIVMLLRNLDVSRGLCNGTRFVVMAYSARILQCKFICGARKGSVVFIPRIDNFTEKGLPFRLRRRQFPVRLAFAMTINKSQGQSLTHVGLYLPQHVFGHGQLYVAMSRARSMQGCKILSLSGTYKNVVEKSVL